MVRKLLATTALAGVLATGAFAQDATAPATTTPPAATGTMAPAGTEAMTPAPAETMASGTAEAPMAGTVAYMQTLGANQYLESDLNGATVYASNAADAETAGEIENFVVDADGTVVAVILETAFLEENKTIAVPFDRIDWVAGDNNTQRAVLTASREDLIAAPAFTGPTETAAINATGTMGGGTMAPATGLGTPVDGTAMAPAGTVGTMAPAAGTDTAMAPVGGAAPMAPADTAATTTAPVTGTDTAMAPAAGTGTAATPGTEMAAGATGGTGGEYLAMLTADQHLSRDIIGQNIYSGPGAEAENIGNVNDLVISSDGTVEAFLIGVGGFLGIGQKDVGVPFDQITLVNDENNQPRSVLAATRDQLTEAPAFDARANEMAATTAAPAGGNVSGMAPAGNTDVAATAPAAGGLAAGGAAGMAAGGMAAGTAGDTTASLGGAQNMNALTPVTGAELSADNLIGTNVYGPDNQTIGSIGDIALTAEGQVDAIIVDVGGFLGIGAKPVAVAMENLQFMRDSGGSITLTTQFTQEQLEGAPEYDRSTYAQNRDAMRLENASSLPPAGVDPAAAPATTPTTVQ